LFAVIRGGQEDHAVRAIEVEGDSFPLRVRSGRDVLVLDHAPSRVLPAFASAVDFLVDLLPPERVVALPSTASEWSVLATMTGEWRARPVLTAFSAEEVLALSPDLVLVQSWLSPSTIETLRRKNVPVLDLPLPNDWEGILQTIRALGALLEVRERAESVVSGLETRRIALAARKKVEIRALCYSNRGGGGDTAGRDSTGDLMLELAGLSNAAREIGLEGNPPIDHETILLLAPDLFVVAAAPSSTQSPAAEYLRADAKLASLPAVREGRIAVLPVELFSTASQHLLDAAETLAAIVDHLPPMSEKR
jgi:iron complex transport system substrate-binding protein